MPPKDLPAASVARIGYGEFSARLHRGYAPSGAASSATLEVTRRCPLACAHCYNNLPMGDQEARDRELSAPEWRRILDELKAAGTLWLCFTGGEIFARHDFLDIYAHAKNCGFLVTLFTNGTLITPRVADYLAEWRPFSIEITLYGATRETYERLTGAPGSYDRCLRGVRLLRERGLPLTLKTVAVSVNKHEIGAMKAMAESLGVPFKFDAMMTPRIDCSQSPLAVRLQPWEIVKLDLEDSARVEEWRRLARRLREITRPTDSGDQLYQCGAGVMGFAVDPQGKLSMCTMSHVDTFDLREGSFGDGWDFLRDGVRKRKITRVTKCTSCQIRDLCGMCPANGELENADAEAPVDFLCHVAHLRAQALGIEVPAHGDCDYCKDGRRHGVILDSLATLQSRRHEQWRGPADASPRVIPIASGPRAAGGGCGSCAAG